MHRRSNAGGILSTGCYSPAAQSLALHAHCEATADAWSEVVERAMRMGEEAVRADPANPEAHCHFAHAVARYAQRVSALTALRKNLAGKIRDLLRSALDIDPEHALTHLMLGIRHADVAASGFLARRLYGANREQAVHHYERAPELEPESKILLYEYGIGLSGLDGDGGTERSRKMLEKALEPPVRDAHEQYVQPGDPRPAGPAYGQTDRVTPTARRRRNATLQHRVPTPRAGLSYSLR